MRILFVNQFFWPDEAPTGRLVEDLSRELAAQGHDVSVICGPSQYRGASQRERPPVTIVRLPGVRFSRSSGQRLISWLGFLVGAGLRALITRRPDVVVALTTPPGLSLALLPAKMLRRSKLWIWEMDVYPDIAVAAGLMTERSLAYRAVGSLIDYSRTLADGAIAVGQCMKNRLVTRGVSPDRIFVHENWAEVAAVPPSTFLPNAPIRVLYSGNFGFAHDLETILAVIRSLANNAQIRFVFAGGGVRRGELERVCADESIANVTFLPHLSVERFHEEMAACHIGLVTLRDQSCGAVVPSKLYSLLAAGRPVLYIGPADATPAHTLSNHNCGWSFRTGQAASIASLLKCLAENPRLIRNAAAKALLAHTSHLRSGLAVPRLAARLCERSSDAQAYKPQPLAFEKRRV